MISDTSRTIRKKKRKFNTNQPNIFLFNTMFTIHFKVNSLNDLFYNFIIPKEE